MTQTQEPQRSRKSKAKKRPPEWEARKVELAKELGLWDKVQAEGWAGLSAAESGKLGGMLSSRYPGRAPRSTADDEQLQNDEQT